MNNIPSLNNIKDTLINTISRNKEILTGVVTGASEATKLVVTATNNEQWGPTGPQMRQISDLTFNYTDCSQIMETIWERLSTDINFGANWRNIYKTLLLLDYVVRNGSERVVNEARQNIYQLKALSTVHYIDSEGTDRGVSIRERSKQVVELLGDTVRLREERKKCKQNRDKYSTAYGSESYEHRYHSRGGSTWGEDDDLSYSPRGRSNNNQFDINEDDFKDDLDQPTKTRSVTSTKPAKQDDDFEPFVEPKTQQPAWDPFEGQRGSTTKPTVDDWDDFNPRGNPPPASNNAWNTQAPGLGIGAPIITNPVISNPTNPIISNPTNPIISNPPTTGISTAPISSSLPSNLFVNPSYSNTLPSNPPTSTLETPKNNPPQVSPSKPNDPWANSHLFASLSSPNKTNSTGGSTTAAKPLGATVGPGWGITTPPATTTVPVTYATYPNMPVTGTYPVAYTTYPPTANIYTTTPSYTNTSTWGM
jgi:epsin